jgi:hypothetical protein
VKEAVMEIGGRKPMDTPDLSRRSLLKMAAAALSSSVSLVGATRSAKAATPTPKISVQTPTVIVRPPTTVSKTFNPTPKISRTTAPTKSQAPGSGGGGGGGPASERRLVAIQYGRQMGRTPIRPLCT